MKNLLLIVIPALLLSCGHKAWIKRGFKKGWIDTARVINVDTFFVDSSRVQKITDTFLLALWDTLEIESPCDSLGKLTTKGKTIIRTMIEEKYLPAVMYPSDTLHFKDRRGNTFKLWHKNNMWLFESSIKETSYNCPEPSRWLLVRTYWLELLLILVIGIFLGLIIRK